MSGAAGIRDSADADMAAIQRIYAHYVLNDTGNFEEAAPDLAEMTARRRAILDRGYPYIVAAAGDAVRGFAYAGACRPRPAYRYTVENTVYVDPDATGQGLGGALLGTLVARCGDLGYRQMVAVIGGAANDPSITLHAKLGFRRVAHLQSVGYKFGRWIDLVVMQRALGPGDDVSPA